MSLEVDGVWKSGVWAFTVWGEGVWREGAAPEPEPEPEPEVQVQVSGVKRRIVRRSDFSTQANYEFALRAALLEANFAVAPEEAETPLKRDKPKPSLPKSLPLDKSLSIDSEIKVSARNFAALQRASEMEERELLQLFISVIESEYD